MLTRKIPIRFHNVLTFKKKKINFPPDETKNDNNLAQIMRTI